MRPLGAALMLAGFALAALLLYLEARPFPIALRNMGHYGWSLEVCLQQSARCTAAWGIALKRAQAEGDGPRVLLDQPVPAAGLALVVFAVGALLFSLGTPKPKPLYGQRWASSSELRALLRRARTCSLLLAQFAGRILTLKPQKRRASPEIHGLVVGATGAGKSTALIANLLTWGGSAVVVDAKDRELFCHTSATRAGFGAVYALDPKGKVGHRFDPIGALEEPDDFYLAALEIMEPWGDKTPYFAERVANLLAAILYDAQLSGFPALTYLLEAVKLGLVEVAERLLRSRNEQITVWVGAFFGKGDISPADLRQDSLMDSWTTLTSRVAPLITPGIQNMFAGNDFGVAELLERLTTLYLLWDEEDLARTGKVLQLVLWALSLKLTREAKRREGSIPILLALDEAGRVAPSKLAELLALGRSRGIVALLYAQSLGQFEANYGRAVAESILGNCRAQVFHGGNDDGWTKRHVSERCGRTAVKDRRVSRPQGWFTPETLSEGERPRELLAPEEFAAMSPDRVVVFAPYGQHSYPILASRLDWRRWRWMRRRATLPPLELPELPTSKPLGTPLTEEISRVAGYIDPDI